MQAEIIGISLATAPGKAAYIPLGHRNGATDLLGAGLLAGQIPLAEALARLKPLLEDPSVLKIGQNLKPLYLLLSRHGIAVAPYDDTMLIVLRARCRQGRRRPDRARRALARLHADQLQGRHAGTGRQAVTFDRVPVDRATEYAAEDADVTLRLWMTLKPRLVAERMVNLYETLERPLVPVLARMEERGIKVDRQILSRLSGEFSQKLGGLEDEIYELAGESFNIGSPKQLGDILFGKFGLPGGKKTKTGAWSTGADVLDELAAAGNDARRPHPRLAPALQAEIDLHRSAARLHPPGDRPRPHLVRARRDHDRPALLVRAEPAEHPDPHRGRAGASAPPSSPSRACKLISADYSQIELRILAHIADIPELKQAFAEGLDIHAMTASEMFGVPVDGMPREVRRRAKAINFGIIYGISAFGLANQLGIPREEAGAYIKRYFERFPGIRDYMEAMRRQVREHGYVTTLFGRKIHFPQVEVGQRRRARLRRPRLDQRPDPGHRRRHHPPRHDPHGAGARRRRACRRRCCCRCTTN